MGKMLCDAAETIAPALPLLQWADPAAASPWGSVWGLEDQQRRSLERISEKGVAWKNTSPPDASEESAAVVFRLEHGGEVDADGNCLFTAARKAMMVKATARDLRHRTVRRFSEEYEKEEEAKRVEVDAVIRHLYSPDLRSGWGIHVVQETKLLAKKADRNVIDSAISELVEIGLQREMAAETIYKERCVAVKDGPSWAKYMAISGSMEDEYDIITLQYTEEGLLSVNENRDGRAAAFGDDIAIECLATEFKREVYVVQAHGSDGMVDEENCLFFLPHRPRGPICETPIFLFMKGTGWCGAGADHYEPLIASPIPHVSTDKAAIML